MTMPRSSPIIRCRCRLAIRWTACRSPARAGRSYSFGASKGLPELMGQPRCASCENDTVAASASGRNRRVGPDGRCGSAVRGRVGASATVPEADRGAGKRPLPWPATAGIGPGASVSDVWRPALRRAGLGLQPDGRPRPALMAHHTLHQFGGHPSRLRRWSCRPAPGGWFPAFVPLRPEIRCRASRWRAGAPQATGRGNSLRRTARGEAPAAGRLRCPGDGREPIPCRSRCGDGRAVRATSRPTGRPTACGG